jgi:phage portal protein BeeE
VTNQADGPEILRIAAQTGLTAYDAAYIAPARREKADLLTNDARLSQAARAALLHPEENREGDGDDLRGQGDDVGSAINDHAE